MERLENYLSTLNISSIDEDIIKDIVREYALNCIKASFKRCANEDSFHINDEECGNMEVVEKLDITDTKNIVLL